MPAEHVIIEFDRTLLRLGDLHMDYAPRVLEFRDCPELSSTWGMAPLAHWPLEELRITAPGRKLAEALVPFISDWRQDSLSAPRESVTISIPRADVSRESTQLTFFLLTVGQLIDDSDSDAYLTYRVARRVPHRSGRSRTESHEV